MTPEDYHLKYSKTMLETKHNLLWRVLREDKYETLFAERIADHINENVVQNEEGMRSEVRRVAEMLISGEIE